jgi:hypothetical protein
MADHVTVPHPANASGTVWPRPRPFAVKTAPAPTGCHCGTGSGHPPGPSVVPTSTQLSAAFAARAAAITSFTARPSRNVGQTGAPEWIAARKSRASMMI